MANLAPYVSSMTQAATYWPPGVNDGFGRTSFGAPVAIFCRWQNTATMFRDAQGREVVSSAVVYPDRALLVGGFLADGSFADADPRGVAGAYEIRQIGTSPGLSGDKQLNKVWL